MILSPRYKVLFIHCPKAAGTSIRSLFAERDPGWIPFRDHMRASEAERVLPRVFYEWKRVGSVRHPCDLLVSEWFNIQRMDRHWSTGIVRGMEFGEWLRWRETQQGAAACAFYLDRQMDYVVRYEDFDAGVRGLMEFVGMETLGAGQAVPHCNPGVNREAGGGWRQYYRADDLEYVRRVFDEDFRRFGYSI